MLFSKIFLTVSPFLHLPAEAEQGQILRRHRPPRHQRLSALPRLLLLRRRVPAPADDPRRRKRIVLDRHAGRLAGQAAASGRDESEVRIPA